MCKYDQLPKRPALRTLRPHRQEHGRNVRGTTSQWPSGTGVAMPDPAVTGTDGSATQMSDADDPMTLSFEELQQCPNLPDNSMDWGVPGMPDTSRCELSPTAYSFEETFGSIPRMRPSSFDNSLPTPEPFVFPPVQNTRFFKGLQPGRSPVPPEQQGSHRGTEPSPASDKRDTLAPRLKKTVATCFSAKVLLGQLFSYPKMMATGTKLPPFIFPPCALDGLGPSADCHAIDGRHQCLPEALAICSSLVHSFETRTPGNASFVWKNIYTEVMRLNQEVSS